MDKNRDVKWTAKKIPVYNLKDEAKAGTVLFSLS